MQAGDAERMFAAFRLGVPCRTQPIRRDLTGDASDLLAVEREAFLAECRRENGWLEDLGNTVFLDAYVKDFTASLALQHLVPIMVVPDNTDTETFPTWLSTFVAAAEGL